MSALEELEAALRAEGGLIAQQTGSVTARCAPYADDLATEAVREGYLLHYEEGRVVRPEGDPDLALLAGDRLYALGLEHLAQAGDLQTISALAEIISAAAIARSQGDIEAAEVAWRERAK